jgi:thymidine kinase
MANVGSIELITGPMFSGKSTTLIARIERYLFAKKKVIALKWRGDNRYTKESQIVTHSDLRCDCVPCNDDELKTLYNDVLHDYDVICIDEGSFFKDIVAFCEMLANKGHTVIVASLIGTYQRIGFNDILNLVPKCEKVTMLTAVCTCCFSDGAAFTKLTRTDVEHDGKELVGGKESYMAVCRKCFFDNTTNDGST